jgi:hypothetical protein
VFAKIERYAESLGMDDGLLGVLLHDFDDGYGFRHGVSVFRFWRWPGRRVCSVGRAKLFI